MLRFADGELDLAETWVGRDAGKELTEFLERVGVELGEIRIHVVCGDL